MNYSMTQGGDWALSAESEDEVNVSQASVWVDPVHVESPVASLTSL